MKTNPLFYKRSNANKGKIARAKKLFFLSLILLTVITGIYAASFQGQSTEIKIKGAVFYAALVIFPAGVKGTVKDHGHDETDAEYEARKGAAESAEAFVKRYLKFLENKIESIKVLSKDIPELKEYRMELEAFKETIKGLKADADLMKNIKDEVGKQNLVIESMREKGMDRENTKNLKAQIADWLKENKSAIDIIKSGSKAELKTFVAKLNSPMTPSNTYSASTYLPQVEYLPGVIEIVRVEPTLWDYIRKGRTSSATLVWVNKYTPEGAADFIAPGVAKPGISFKLQTETSVAKKVAVSAKTSTELLDDIPGMQTFIEQELQYQLKHHINAAVMAATASSTDINGIQTLATTYTLTGVATTDPNNWDAIMAAVAQLRSGNLQGPVTIFVNPVDYANMMLTKAQAQGQLFVPANAGATIVQDNNVTVGSVLVALLDYYKISIYKDMEIKFGWEEDDFTKNLVTAICESRFHQYFSANHTGAFIYDTFANIKTAITAV